MQSTVLSSAGISADWRVLFGDENVFVLAVHPGDETRLFGGLIARACMAGRPPFVAILTDGAGECRAHDVALRRERETRAATARLGLDAERLLFIGLSDGRVPTHGAVSEALVAAIDLLMWRRDCHVLCAAAEGDADTLAGAELARAVARRTGLRLVLRTHGPASVRLDATGALPALCRARAELSPPIAAEITTAEAYAPADIERGRTQ